MKCAIVTGASGFLGSALIREMTGHGVKVYAVVRNESSRVEQLKALSGVEIVCCDMEDLAELPEKVQEQPEVYYHMAWEGSSGPARADYTLQLKNVRWMLDGVNAAKKLGCKRFVGAGALAEFDVNAYTPLDGSTPNRVSCYGAAKIAAHLMTKAECCALGIDHLWAFISNTYGVGNYTSNFVNFASKTMLTGQPANFTAGEQPYDFVHVSDTAQGLFCIGDRGKANCSYYIGSSHPAKLKQFICQLRDEIDPGIQLYLGAVPFNGVQHAESVFDCTPLMRDTGYQPRVTFQEGLRMTIPWLRKQIGEGKI